MPTVYESSLQHVQQKKHVLVHQFQFQKMEISGGTQWWNVRNLKTGSDQKISGTGKLYESLRDITNNKLIWADTLLERSEQELEDDFAAAEKEENARREKINAARVGGGPSAPAAVVVNDSKAASAPNAADLDLQSAPAVLDQAPAPPSKSAAPKAGKKINREYKLPQQQAILNEVVFGVHKNRKGQRICAFRRNDHGNNGAFFLSVTANLNRDSTNGPFKEAPAVQDTVRAFTESSVEARKTFLEAKYGKEYMNRPDWNIYDDDLPFAADASDEIKLNYKLQSSIAECLDSLVYGAFEADAPPTVGKYDDKDDDALADKADGKAGKRPCLEKMREKTVSIVQQLSSKQDGLAELFKSVSSLITSPMPAFAAPAMLQAAPPADQFDQELLPLFDSLKNLADPPGTSTACKLLASSLGNYGITKLDELRAMKDDEACDLLKELKWSALQIQKVLHPKP
jgi:hypothetical protein